VITPFHGPDFTKDSLGREVKGQRAHIPEAKKNSGGPTKDKNSIATSSVKKLLRVFNERSSLFDGAISGSGEPAGLLPISRHQFDAADLTIPVK
jgi:hypothetical protein